MGKTLKNKLLDVVENWEKEYVYADVWGGRKYRNKDQIYITFFYGIMMVFVVVGFGKETVQVVEAKAHRKKIKGKNWVWFEPIYNNIKNKYVYESEPYIVPKNKNCWSKYGLTVKLGKHRGKTVGFVEVGEESRLIKEAKQYAPEARPCCLILYPATHKTCLKLFGEFNFKTTLYSDKSDAYTPKNKINNQKTKRQKSHKC